MFYYLICFIFSSFLFWLGGRIKREHAGFRLIIYGMALLIPAILAGIRDVSVGTDVLIYGYPVFKDAYYAFDFDFLINQWQRIEIGYLWLNYVISSLTPNHNIFFGLIMFIEVLFVFLTLRQWKSKIPVWLGMLIFYFMFFNSSLNLMRQSLALSIAFFGMRYVFERKFFYFTFWVLIGCLFHKSALLLLLYYPFWIFANKFTSKKSIILFAGIGIICILVFQQVLADYMSSMGDLASRASAYIEMVGKDKFPYSTLIFYSLITVLFLYNRGEILSDFPETGYFIQYLVAMLIFIPFLDFYGGVFAYRFFALLTWWLFILIPIVFYSFKNYRKATLNIAIISYCSFYWYYTIIYQNANETADYLTIFGK